MNRKFLPFDFETTTFQVHAMKKTIQRNTAHELLFVIGAFVHRISGIFPAMKFIDLTLMLLHETLDIRHIYLS